MVKIISQFGFVAALVLAGALGCNKTSTPVVPAGAAVLHLTIPPKIQGLLSKAPGNVTAQNAVPLAGQGALEYYLSADGQAPVTGFILFSDGSQVGNIFINLPKAGVWLVAAEYFSVSNPSLGTKKPAAKLALGGGLVANPEFAGADKVDVQGTTNFTLNMGQISNGTEGTCYNGDITDSTDCDFNLGGVSWQDVYTFNTGVEFASNTSTATTTGDIQALFDLTTLSTYVGSPTGASFAYLGNGDLVDFPAVPAGTTFYPDSLSAKAAVVGAASAAITVNDVFVVKGPEPNQMVWFQVWVQSVLSSCYPVASATNSSLMQFWFVYNDEGLDYMKFDETTNGHINCNQNTIPTATPSPTATP